MDCEWHSGAWIEVLSLPVPAHVAESDESAYRRHLAEYIDRSAMVLEDWDQRDAEWLGEFRWGWVDYDRELAYLCLEVEGFADLRLFLWVNDFALARSRTIHVIAVSENGAAYLQGRGIDILLQRRDDVIAQLSRGEAE
jgi:hypothetical protein